MIPFYQHSSLWFTFPKFLPSQQTLFLFCVFFPMQWVDNTGSAPQKTSLSAEPRREPSLHQHQLRIQDQEFQEGFDGGWCLSMHQPWASLLVRGIKR